MSSARTVTASGTASEASSDKTDTLNERVVDFLYVLMRDHLPCGVVEEIVQNHVEYRDKPRYNENEHMMYPIQKDYEPCKFSNLGLEMYARNLATRLHANLDA